MDEAVRITRQGLLKPQRNPLAKKSPQHGHSHHLIETITISIVAVQAPDQRSSSPECWVAADLGRGWCSLLLLLHPITNQNIIQYTHALSMRLAAISLVLVLLLLQQATAAISQRSGQQHGTPTAKVRQLYQQSPTYVRSSSQFHPWGILGSLLLLRTH